jgi:hypothetical protein
VRSNRLLSSELERQNLNRLSIKRGVRKNANAQKSGEKDERGKPIKEERRRVIGNTETKITVNRSKSNSGKRETNVLHEVKKNGKTVHGPHLEPKGKRKAIEP